MNKYLTIALSFAAGTILGGTGCYFIMKGRLEKEAEGFKEDAMKMVDEEIEKARLHYEEKLEEVKKETESNTTENILNTIKTAYSPSSEVKDDAEEKEFDEKIFPHTKPKKELTNYVKYGSTKHLMEQYEEELEDEEEDAEGINVYPREGLAEIPYKITESDFMQRNEFDKIGLIYWKDDDILSTEDGENLEPELKNTVGEDFLKLIDDLDSDEPTYIRNEKMGTDYELYVENGSYYDTYIKE